MSDLHKNLVSDAELFTRSQINRNDLGIDLKDAVEDYLKMIINSDKNRLITEFKQKQKNDERFLWYLNGKIWITDDFDSPLEDMKDYIEIC
ncbi:MAG: DUF2281 domain-containing protein [Candidatus Cloacimonetes bacterium]|nr:DUF2281 domain-containing protein [Candidatus Cloacimonadota bacterium]